MSGKKVKIALVQPTPSVVFLGSNAGHYVHIVGASRVDLQLAPTLHVLAVTTCGRLHPSSAREGVLRRVRVQYPLGVRHLLFGCRQLHHPVLAVDGDHR